MFLLCFSFFPFLGVTELTRVVHVACSWYHSCALTDVGLLYTWGDGSDGALGHGNNDSVLRPRMVEYFTDLESLAKEKEEEDNLNTRRRGDNNSNKKTNTMSTTPILIIDVACGSDNLGAHTCAVSSKGKLYSWGVGGTVGNNSMTSSTEPIKLGDDSSMSGQRFVHVSCGKLLNMYICKHYACVCVFGYCYFSFLVIVYMYVCTYC